jgi:hypothetical protein
MAPTTPQLRSRVGRQKSYLPILGFLLGLLLGCFFDSFRSSLGFSRASSLAPPTFVAQQHVLPHAVAELPAALATPALATPPVSTSAAPVIHVVYFALIPSDRASHTTARWRSLISLQLSELNEWNISANAATIDVVLATPAHPDPFSPDPELLLHEAFALVRGILPGARVTRSPLNRFEYPGILALWELAQYAIPRQDAHNHVVLYFHSKEMINHKNAPGRGFWNGRLSRVVVRDWRRIVARFAADPGVNKAGYHVSELGWVWWNFYWVRASYLLQLTRPTVSSYRHYYEFWLGQLKPYPPGQAFAFPEKVQDFSPLPRELYGDSHDSLGLCDRFNSTEWSELGWWKSPWTDVPGRVLEGCGDS